MLESSVQSSRVQASVSKTRAPSGAFPIWFYRAFRAVGKMFDLLASPSKKKRASKIKSCDKVNAQTVVQRLRNADASNHLCRCIWLDQENAQTRTEIGAGRSAKGCSGEQIERNSYIVHILLSNTEQQVTSQREAK
jgi:hypothetical protein